MGLFIYDCLWNIQRSYVVRILNKREQAKLFKEAKMVITVGEWKHIVIGNDQC
jgi:hypothetical protein